MSFELSHEISKKVRENKKRNSCISLALLLYNIVHTTVNLIFAQMKVCFELIDTSEYYCSAFLHLTLLLLTLKVPLWWTLFKPLFLNIILTHVTKGLIILCLWLSILGGVDVRFTQEPSNPSYFNNGSDANLVWDYTDPQNKIQYIIYSVLVDGTFVRIMVNDSRGVQEHPNIPPSYKGRVKIEGRATLVIKNINPGDNTEFKCSIREEGSVESIVQLIVAGTYHRHNH